MSKIYDICDLAITHLGLYKIDASVSSGLKSREYLAKGLPIVAGSELDVCEGEEYKYIVKFANDSTPIDMEKVVTFYDEVYKENKNDVIANIRKFAEQKIGMRQAMKEVVDYLQSESID